MSETKIQVIIDGKVIETTIIPNTYKYIWEEYYKKFKEHFE